MKVKRRDLNNECKVLYLGNRWNVCVPENGIITFISDTGTADVLYPEGEEFEVIYPVTYHCMCCLKELKTNPDWGIEGGIQLIGSGNYGSKYDGKAIEIVICDECISTITKGKSDEN